MRKPRKTIILLIAIFAVFGLNRHRLLAGGSNQRAISAPAKVVTVDQPCVSQTQKSEREAAGFAPVSMPALAAHLPKAQKISSLSDDANALVSEMCTLHLLADDKDISLSAQEWSAFATVVLQIQAIRQSYEAQIANSQVIAPGRYRLEIPAYAGVGDALREKFHAELCTELGEAKAIDVLVKLGGRLEGHFAGFGISTQTLDITAAPGGSARDMEVTRTVTYWNSVDGNDSLTTRREVHFPAFEDPTGDSWSSLLAVVKA